MEALNLPSALTKLSFCLRRPKPSLNPYYKSKYKPKASTFACNSSKWADRLLPDFHFPSTSAATAVADPPSPPLLPPIPPPTAPYSSDRSIPLPIDFYQVCTPFISSQFHLKVIRTPSILNCLVLGFGGGDPFLERRDSKGL